MNFRRAHLVFLALLLIGCSLLTGCFSDSTTTAFVNRCVKVSNGNESSCSCAANSVKGILDADQWRIFGLVLEGKQADADVELAKAGLGATFSLMGKVTMALQASGNKCSVNLSRM